MNEEQRALAEAQTRRMFCSTVALWTYTERLAAASAALAQAADALQGASNSERAIVRHLNVDGVQLLDPTVASGAARKLAEIREQIAAAHQLGTKLKEMVDAELRATKRKGVA